MLAIQEMSPVIASQWPATKASTISPRSLKGKCTDGVFRRGSSAS